MTEHHDRIEVFRETDRWLRRALIYVPIMSFVVGWGSGVVTTTLFIRAVSKEVTILQLEQKEQDIEIKRMDQIQQQVVALVAKMWGIRISR